MELSIRLKSGAATNSMLLAFVKVITSLLSMATTRILCSILSETQYGTYSQVLLIVSTIASITILGMTDAVNYFYNKHYGTKKANEYVATIFFLQLIVSFVGFVFVFVCKGFIVQYFGNSSLQNLLFFAAILPFINNLLSMLQVLFISIGKAKLIAFRNLIVSILNLCCFSIGCYVTNDIRILLVITISLNALQIVYLVIVLMKNGLKIRFRDINISLSSKVFKYCIPMEMFILTNALSRDMDKYVISGYESTEVVAMYTNAAKVLPFDIIMTSFLTVLIPIITKLFGEKNNKEASVLYSDFLMFSCITTMIMAAGVIPIAENVVQFLYSSKYIDATPIFRVYIIVDIIRFMSLSLVLSAVGKTKLLMRISIGSLFANLILNIILYKMLGVIGPSIATLLIMFVSGLLMIHFSAVTMGTKMREIFNIKILLSHLIKITVLCMVEGLLKHILDGVIDNYLVTLVICFGTYFILAILIFKNIIIYYFTKLNERRF